MRLSNRIVKIINSLYNESHQLTEKNRNKNTYTDLLQELYPLYNQSIRLEKGVEYYIEKNSAAGIDIFWYPHELHLNLVDFKSNADYKFELFIETNEDYFQHYNKLSCLRDIKTLHKYFSLVSKIEEELVKNDINFNENLT